MKIAVDAHGGDNAPIEIIRGCKLAIDAYDVEIVLTGNKAQIKEIMKTEGISENLFKIVNTTEVITMEDDPTDVVKAKKESSMAVAFKLVKDGVCDAFVSAGNSGAILVGATMIVKRIKGVKRAALAGVFPSETGPLMLTDIGANVVCKPEYIEQFAMMGAEYMKHMFGIKNPKVALLNNGTEEHKGTQLHQDAYQLLKNSPINFVGNMEGRDIAFGGVDVAVTDGFTGNIALKTYEGVGKMMSNGIKGVFKHSIKTKIGALFVMKQLNDFKKKFDYKEYGGAPLLGISKPVIKAHGSSDAKAIKNAIRQAIEFDKSGMIQIITDNIANSTKE